MSFIKSIFKSIKKHKVIFIFLTLQFIICYFMIMRSYSTYKIMNSKVDNVNKYIHVKSTYFLVLKNERLKLVYSGEDIKFFKEAKTLQNIKAIGTYDYREPTKSALNYGMLSINYDMLKIINAKLSEGRNFEPSDFKDKETDYSIVPILIGDKMKAQYKIGDTILSEAPSFKDTKFQVIGILKPNQSFLGNQILNEKPINLDSSFIVPATFNIGQQTNSYGNVFVQISSNDKKVINNLEDLGKKYKIYFDINNIKELIELQYQDDLTIFRNYLPICIFVLIFSLFGVSVTMIMLVKSRKREFGIRIATGCTKSYIYKFILGEIFIVDILSFLASILIFKGSDGIVINTCMADGFFGLFNYKIILAMLIGSFLLILLFSIGSARSIYKMEPRELIKGRD